MLNRPALQGLVAGFRFIRFPAMPVPAVRQHVKELGYRWTPELREWRKQTVTMPVIAPAVAPVIPAVTFPSMADIAAAMPLALPNYSIAEIQVTPAVSIPAIEETPKAKKSKAPKRTHGNHSFYRWPIPKIEARDYDGAIKTDDNGNVSMIDSPDYESDGCSVYHSTVITPLLPFPLRKWEKPPTIPALPAEIVVKPKGTICMLEEIETGKTLDKRSWSKTAQNAILKQKYLDCGESTEKEIVLRSVAGNCVYTFSRDNWKI